MPDQLATIGYLSHTDSQVRLYLQETYTFLYLTSDPGPSGLAEIRPRRDLVPSLFLVRHPACKQVSDGLFPGRQIDLVSKTVASLSTEHRQFVFVHLPGSHLTSHARRLSNRAPPGSLFPSSAERFES